MTLHMVWNAGAGNRDPHHGQSFLHQAISRIREVACALHGHDAMLHFERGRMSLRCATCGHETPGWFVGPSRVCSRHSHDQSRAA
jgi:LSD1 subclass zinc finger protein